MVKVIDGAEIEIELQADVGKHLTADVCKLLKEKALAEGDAIFAAAPGNVILIFPPLGMEVFVVN